MAPETEREQAPGDGIALRSDSPSHQPMIRETPALWMRPCDLTTFLWRMVEKSAIARRCTDAPSTNLIATNSPGADMPRITAALAPGTNVASKL
jgi:hypothetical protein